ncbi:glycine cleavage system protein GcvH [Streptomyces paromomycinus]|uniref:Glycine cleavage system H protein n=1 Tax=Streptomyces paromomycinus TaxID=92743 RepID=A0A401WAB0_STREY|nr:glycine cleavage system protein GcvH [Streptomyces paromomycinus]GCD46244.1 glycine cleavage system H protein [Streptomyces paromomycinus]
MANIPADLSYTKDHEWVRVRGDQVTVGITDHAQRQLGDIVYAELPKQGERFEAGDAFGSLESVKAVTEVYVPLTGTVLVVNETVNDAPEQINDEPYGAGWLIVLRLSRPAELDGLMDAKGYESYLQEGTQS